MTDVFDIEVIPEDETEESLEQRAAAAKAAAKEAKEIYKEAKKKATAKPKSYKMRKRLVEATQNYQALQEEAVELHGMHRSEVNAWKEERRKEQEEQDKIERRERRAHRTMLQEERKEELAEEIAAEAAAKKEMQDDLAELKQNVKAAKKATEKKPGSLKLRKKYIAATEEYRAAQVTVAQMMSEMTVGDEQSDTESEESEDEAVVQERERNLAELKSAYKAAKKASEDKPGSYKKKKAFLEAMQEYKAAQVAAEKGAKVVTANSTATSMETQERSKNKKSGGRGGCNIV